MSPYFVRAMPQIGHVPGFELTTFGCIAQWYWPLDAGTVAAVGAGAAGAGAGAAGTFIFMPGMLIPAVCMAGIGILPMPPIIIPQPQPEPPP
jgi:hypothetical protein